MKSPRRPAAFAGPDAEDERELMAAARDRGWPTPQVYADGADTLGQSPALDRLTAAVMAGRHDGLLMAAPADPAAAMELLLHCTRHGVTVVFVAAARGPSQLETPPAAAFAMKPSETWDVLAQARLEALAGLFPDWRIWLDRLGWHARRRSDGFMQGYRPGSPAFHVLATSATDLAGQLCWQQAADQHAPNGCQASGQRSGEDTGAASALVQ